MLSSMATRPLSSFEMLPMDKPKRQVTSAKFGRPCCEKKKNLKEEDLYITEGWELPKTGKVKEKYKNYRYEFGTQSNFLFEQYSKKKSCCKSVEKADKKTQCLYSKWETRKNMKDTFCCECNHCVSFYKNVISRHKIPFMEENRSSTKNVVTTQRQYHTRKSWRDEYGVRKGDRVVVDGKLGGKAMYIGYLQDDLLAPELYVGVKLDEPTGNLDTGIHDGKYFFEAPPGFGMFVKYERIAKVRKFDPTEEGGPDKKVLKNQASLAWLYGQSLDEAEIREYALNRNRTGSPKPHRMERLTMEQKQQREMQRDWIEKHGESNAKRMMENYQKLFKGYKQSCEEERIRKEREDAEELARRLEEQARLEEEAAARAELGSSDESYHTTTSAVHSVRSEGEASERNSGRASPIKAQGKKTQDKKKNSSASSKSSSKSSSTSASANTTKSNAG